jgi:hypothetical protein
MDGGPGLCSEEPKTMKPPVSALSTDFKYAPAVSTDVGRTFARIGRAEREQAQQRRLADAAGEPTCVPAANDAASSWRHCRIF